MYLPQYSCVTDCDISHSSLSNFIFTKLKIRNAMLLLKLISIEISRENLGGTKFVSEVSEKLLAPL